ncbi:MAG: PAS domain S-box protein, partial [Nitrospirales bacterium]|nr:PAS domain S-box protein [Nitrospirales bacterium]
LGRALVTIGLLGLLFERSLGDLVAWVGRGALFLAAPYLLVAVLQAEKAHGFAASLVESAIPARTIIESISDALVALDQNGCVVYWNAAAQRLFGCGAAEVFGNDFISLVVPDSFRDEARGILAGLSRGEGKPSGERMELTIRDCRGRDFTAEMVFYMSPATEGRLIVVVIGDVSERKRMEEELRHHRDHLEELVKLRTDELETLNRELTQEIAERARTDEALRLSEERFRSLFNGMTEGFALHEIICDDKGTPIDYRFLDINPAFELLTGLRRDDVVGRLKSDVLPNDDPEWVRLYGSVALTGDPVGFERYSPALERVYEVFAYCPAPFQFAAVFMDITDRKRTEDEIRQLNEILTSRAAELEAANEKLRELDRLKSLFIASMSHELRTPLNNIIGFTGIMLQGMAGELNEEQRKQLTIVKEGSLHLLSLINDIIDISKIEAGKVDLYIREFDLSELVREVSGGFAGEAQKKGVEIIVHTPETLVIESDKRRTRQILMNLTDNAVKFTDSGKIEVSLTVRDGGVDVSVSDTGIGIKMEDLGRLFCAFSQVVSVDRPKEGTGLGLYLSRKIAHLLGGEITVRSELGKGSVFTLSLAGRPEYER